MKYASKCSFYVVAALALPIVSVFAAYGQSFDCKKAETATEHAVCGSKELAELDSRLAMDLRALVARRPAMKTKTLIGERHWLRARDEDCAASMPQSLLEACLAIQYNTRIEMVEAEARRTELKPPPATCEVIADRYRPLAHDHPGKPPLSVLAASSASGINVQTKASEPIQRPSTDLTDWAARQKPPFTLSAALLSALNRYDMLGNGGTIQKAPGIDFYTISRLEGSMACDNSLSFLVRDGVAVPTDTPGEPGADDSCDIGPTYATVDRAVVAIVQDYNWRPGMSANLQVWQWDGSAFGRTCDIELDYKPRFTTTTLNDWDPSCDGRDCDKLQQAAFELAEAAETDPDALKDKWMKKLLPEQRQQFAAVSERIGAEIGEPQSNDAFVIPYLDQGRLYFVRIGHFAIGWRDFADWSITFLSADNDNLTRHGAFAVGTVKGDLLDVSITQ